LIRLAALVGQGGEPAGRIDAVAGIQGDAEIGAGQPDVLQDVVRQIGERPHVRPTREVAESGPRPAQPGDPVAHGPQPLSAFLWGHLDHKSHWNSPCIPRFPSICIM